MTGGTDFFDVHLKTGRHRHILSILALVAILLVASGQVNAQPMSGLAGLPGRNPYRDRMTYTAPRDLVRQEVSGGKTALKIGQFTLPTAGVATAGLLAMEAADRNASGVWWALVDYSLLKGLTGAFNALRVCGGGNLKNVAEAATGTAAKAGDVLYHTTSEGTIAKVLTSSEGPAMKFFHKLGSLLQGEWAIYFTKIDPAKDWAPRTLRTLSAAAGGGETIIFTGSAATLVRKHSFNPGTAQKAWEGAWVIPFHNVRLLKYHHDVATKTLYVYEAELIQAQAPRWAMALSHFKFNGAMDLFFAGLQHGVSHYQVNGSAPLRSPRPINCNQRPSQPNQNFDFSQLQSGMGGLP